MPHNGIVAAQINIAVMYKQVIRDVSKPCKGIVVVDGDGFIALVTAGHNKSCESLVQDQVMQRRVRQHHTEILVPG